MKIHVLFSCIIPYLILGKHISDEFHVNKTIFEVFSENTDLIPCGHQGNCTKENVSQYQLNEIYNNTNKDVHKAVQKRSAEAWILGWNIFSTTWSVLMFFKDLQDSDNLQRSVKRIEDKINVIHDKLDALGFRVDTLSVYINALIRHQAWNRIIINYADDVQTIEALLDQFRRDIYVSNNNFLPVYESNRWADAVLSRGSDGIDQILFKLHSMVVGGNYFSGGPVIVIFESFLNRDSNSYSSELLNFLEYTIGLQVAGYGMWISALQIKGQTTRIKSILELMSNRLEEQKSFLDTTSILWPEGRWGLPKTNTGCPGNSGFTWLQGRRYHDTEDKDNNNQKTEPNHFPEEIGSNIAQHFCMKSSGGKGSWPAGNYCIFKYGSACPSGFSSGYIYWDDEDSDNNNQHSGYLPYGKYDRNTLIWYCCRSDGCSSCEIVLPTAKPFYLLEEECNPCQQVRHTTVTREMLYWDNEDKNNEDRTYGVHPYEVGGDHNHKLFYCYYRSTLFIQ